MTVKSLFDLSLGAVCQYTEIFNVFPYLDGSCKQKLLQFFTSHDQIKSNDCVQLFSNPTFGSNLTEIDFYLSDQIDDNVLRVLTKPTRNLTRISIVECQNVTDQGIIYVTRFQQNLQMLELRNLRKINSESLKYVRSKYLVAVDLSGCSSLTSDGIFYLVNQNPSIRCLYLNHCRSLDDQALYDIAQCCGTNLQILELDFLPNMVEPAISLQRLSQRCPNLSQLSLCRFFDSTESSDDEEVPDFKIEGENLDYVDLCGNYFQTLPELPITVKTLRLSVTGGEDIKSLLNRLDQLTQLRNIHLELIAPGRDFRSIENANHFLCELIPKFGEIITRLHANVLEIRDDALALITRNLPYLCHLSLDVTHINMYYLHRFFSGGRKSPGARLQSLRLRKLRVSYRLLFAIGRCATSLVDLEATYMISYRLLFAIGRCATSLVDLEATYMSAVDDRFLRLLADNCKELRNVNFNGCKWVTDKGMAALARNGSLREVRIRGTGCTDKSIYNLAQYCPDMEWIAHADFSGKPKFSDEALAVLRNSCIQRVISEKKYIEAFHSITITRE
uniref:Uncharacterized protein n=1 Tax=Panagrolaimus sp. JU765 TaxID=591449 RepID=A0AC34QST3_9BILA